MAAQPQYVLQSGKHQGKTLDELLLENPKAITFMANNPKIRESPAMKAWFDRYLASKRDTGRAPAKPESPVATAKASSMASPAKVTRKTRTPKAAASSDDTSPMLTTGLHKGYTLDWVLKHRPGYIKWMFNRKKYLQDPAHKAWFEAHPLEVETACRAKKAPFPPPTVEAGPVFASGKYQGLSYDLVLKRHPRYIFRLLNRGGSKLGAQTAWLEANRERIQKLRMRFDSSEGERSAAQHLQSLGIDYHYEYTLESLPYKRFDFHFTYQGKLYLVEIDGRQHFEFSKHFHKSQRGFQKCQQTDLLKMQVAYAAGYRMIRIDYTQLDRVDHHIDVALAAGRWYYFSSPDLYRHLNGSWTCTTL